MSRTTASNQFHIRRTAIRRNQNPEDNSPLLAASTRNDRIDWRLISAKTRINRWLAIFGNSSVVRD
jgi:hypothetical protein